MQKQHAVTWSNSPMIVGAIGIVIGIFLGMMMANFQGSMGQGALGGSSTTTLSGTSKTSETWKPGDIWPTCFTPGSGRESGSGSDFHPCKADKDGFPVRSDGTRI